MDLPITATVKAASIMRFEVCGGPVHPSRTARPPGLRPRTVLRSVWESPTPLYSEVKHRGARVAES